MYFIFSLLALFSWSGSDIFSKVGTSQKDKLSHWKVIFFVGIIMGLHAIITIIVSKFINPENIPTWLLSIIYTDFVFSDFIKYLPVASIYLIAMIIGYAGLRYIELSISSPICNSSGSLALIICAILGWAVLDIPSIIGVVLISIGILFLGIVDYNEDVENKILRRKKSNYKYSKSFIAILIPILYLIIDALGTVGDQVVSELELFDMSEYASNTAFEFSALLFSLIAFVWVKFVKKQQFFNLGKSNRISLILGGICETIGQMFYMSVMFSEFKAGMPMISAYCVLSVVWSRIFLKEKLSLKHYVSITITFIGIILLGIFSPI